MRVALTAIADHGDDPALESGRIGVGVVENAGSGGAHRAASVVESPSASTITERTPIIL